jgi:DNA repair protein RadD
MPVGRYADGLLTGKSLVIAEFIRRSIKQWPQTRILVLSHVREILQQNHDALMRFWPGADAGVYSAGLKRKNTGQPVIFGGIQSVHKKAEELGQFDLIVIDEAHRTPKESEGTYRSFITDMQDMNPSLKLVGLTATPYRVRGGLLTTGDGRLFDSVAHEVKLKPLVEQGWLAPLTTMEAKSQIDTDELPSRGGDYILSAIEWRCTDPDMVHQVCCEIITYGAKRDHWLIFCAGVEHVRLVTRKLIMLGINTASIIGDTPGQERDQAIAGFRSGKIKALVNCQTLTTGFDAPETDLLAIIRPTQSTGLYVQMCGRGMRIAPGKSDCVVLDFGGNIERHGPLDNLNIKSYVGKGKKAQEIRICHHCFATIPMRRHTCPECGNALQAERGPSKVRSAASTHALLGGSDDKNSAQYVSHIEYRRHEKPGKPPSLRVEYYGANRCRIASEWVCLEHQGLAKQKAFGWWMSRDQNPHAFPPCDVDAALGMVRYLKKPIAIQTQPDKNNPQWLKIVRYIWD